MFLNFSKNMKNMQNIIVTLQYSLQLVRHGTRNQV